MSRLVSTTVLDPTPASGREIGLSGGASPSLRVIPGGRNCRALVLVPQGAHEELRLELVIARNERLVYAAKVRELVRLAERHLAAGHTVAAATHLQALSRFNEQEAMRATAMQAPACACGSAGIGHGDADDDALPVPVAA
jgi:hypothetical protein